MIQRVLVLVAMTVLVGAAAPALASEPAQRIEAAERIAEAPKKRRLTTRERWRGKPYLQSSTEDEDRRSLRNAMFPANAEWAAQQHQGEQLQELPRFGKGF